MQQLGHKLMAPMGCQGQSNSFSQYNTMLPDKILYWLAYRNEEFSTVISIARSVFYIFDICVFKKTYKNMIV